jgi:hypothetical protein
MIDPVADLDVFLARLDEERARVVAETARAANPHLDKQLPAALEQFDRLKEKLESARPQLEELRQCLLAHEEATRKPKELPAARSNTARFIRKTSSDVKDVSSNPRKSAEQAPSPSSAKEVHELDSRFFKQADEEARRSEDEDE